MPTPVLKTNPIDDGRTWIAVDTETFLIMPGRQAPPLVCVSTCEPSQAPKLYDHIEGLEVFKALVRDDSKILVLANAPFDLNVLCNAAPEMLPWVIRAYLQERIVDIATWQRMYLIKYGLTEFDPILNLPVNDGTFALHMLTKRWLGETVTGKTGEDVWRKRYHELYCVPLDQWPREAWEYAANDAWYTMRCFERMHDREGILPDFWRKMRQNFALSLYTCRGLRSDEVVTRELELEINDHIGGAMLELLDAGIYRIGGTKKAPKLTLTKSEVQRRVEESYGRLGLQVPRTDPNKLSEANRAKSPMGNVKVDDETLEVSDDVDLQLLAEIGSDKTVKTTFMKWLILGTAYPMNPRYSVPVDTGRSSSQKPNCQQFPRREGVRECIVPRKGYIFVDCDYNIAELRSFAQVLINMYGHSAMAETIKQGDARGHGFDIHCVMAAKIMGLVIEDYAARLTSGDKECKNTRNSAKPIDFGVPGGMGAATLVTTAWKTYGIRMTVAEAETYIAFYKELFPEVEQFFTDIGALTGRGGSTTLYQWGSGRIRGGAKFCAACNSNFQGLTADGALEAAWRIMVECYLGIEYVSDEQVLADIEMVNAAMGQFYDDWTDAVEGLLDMVSDLYGSYPVWFIHDENGLESPFAKAVKAAARLSYVMRSSMEVFTPDVPCVAEPDIRRRWYKAAEAAYDKDGVLVPWSPKHPKKILEKHVHDRFSDAGGGQEYAAFAAVLDPMMATDEPWTPEQVAYLDDLFPKFKKHKKTGEQVPDLDFWRQPNKVWSWEYRQRLANPDQWC